MVSKYNPELVDELCKYIENGASNKDAAALCDIHQATFYDWQDEKSQQYHPELSERLKKAETVCKMRCIALIQKAAITTWQAAAWWMERKYPSEFGKEGETKLLWSEIAKIKEEQERRKLKELHI